MTSTVFKAQTCSAPHLSNREPIQLLPDAGSHDWPTEAKFVEVAQVCPSWKTSHAPLSDFLAQLVRLASQHHASEYSCLKFGPQGSARRRGYDIADGRLVVGCPVAYVPFSLQMPERVRQLQAHQARYATTQAWWLCDRRQPPSMAETDDTIELENKPRLIQSSPVSDMQEELRAAMSSTFIPPGHCSPNAPSGASVKTSNTHPIK